MMNSAGNACGSTEGRMGEGKKVEVSGSVSAGVIVEAIILGLFVMCAGDTVAEAVTDAAFTSAQIEMCGADR